MKTYDLMYKGKEFRLVVNKSKPFRRAVVTVAGNLCKFTGHSFCQTYGKIDDWEYESRIPLLTLNLTKSQARAIDSEFADFLD